jgi:exopolysaccharide biosynthesis protein
VYLRKLAEAVQALGAVRAAALDGGSSTALYYRGKSFAVPGRRLTNLLVVYDSASRHEELKHLLAPSTGQLTSKPNPTEQ